MPDSVLHLTRKVASGHTVKTQNGWAYVLGPEIDSGGEGTIFNVQGQPGFVAKIYSPRRCTRWRYEKVKLLQRCKYIGGVCLPRELLFNARGEFVGFLMPRASGLKLQTLLAQPWQAIPKYFPKWRRQDMARLAMTILRVIQQIHEQDILLGDINPSNILIENQRRIHIVDTDSFQIGNYPSPVGTVYFTAPEIQGKNYGEFMRTQGNENFAIATLMFMIMMLGKPPYSHVDGGDPAQNVRDGIFGYGAGSRNGEKQPAGSWPYIWSHMTRKLKEAFKDTFSKDGLYYEERARLNTEDWIYLFRGYTFLLEKGILQKVDPMTDDIFPDRLKRLQGVEYRICSQCEREFPVFLLENGLCPECRGLGGTSE